MSLTLGCCRVPSHCPQERTRNGLFLLLHKDFKESCCSYFPLSGACSSPSYIHSKLTSATEVFSVGGIACILSQATADGVQRLEEGCFPISRLPTPTDYETSADREFGGSIPSIHTGPWETPRTLDLNSSGPRSNALLT